MFVVYLAALALAGAVIHILFFGAPVAATLLAYIGWPAGNPFQKEIAFTNLGLGLCGVLSFLLRDTPLRDGFWLATILFATVFLCGAFTVHLTDRKESGNKKPGNAGPVFFADIVMPTVLWGLYLVL